MTSTTEAPSPEELDPRAELLTALHNMNARAMLISRRGYVGIHSPEYDRRHADTQTSTTCSPSSTAMPKTCRHCGRTDAHCADLAMTCCPLCRGTHP